ncbi:hypothetical protein [Prevotella sp. 10(H)]|uniref:hypothetical protein n=1 Tax=Prevotella sp. 10(H) TaxID=1158294 RepID=UPI0004A76439|nr:hypothetical protein [Prevotella sp. 10(H)]
MKLLNTILWAIVCVCLLSACGDDDDNHTDNGGNGGNNDGGETPIEKVTLITELKKTIEEKQLPYLEFTYDDNNQLTEVVEYKYFDGKAKGATTMSFVKNGKLLTVNSVFRDVAGEEDLYESEKYEMKYDDNGNIIEKKRYNSYGRLQEVYQYTWAKGKIVKIIKAKDETPFEDLYELKWDTNGNVLPISIEEQTASDSYTSSITYI